MGTAVFWVGPVSHETLRPVMKAAGAKLVTLNHGVPQPRPGQPDTAISSNAFKALAVQLGAQPLDNLLSRAKLPLGSRVVLAAFSAGGAFVERVLTQEAGDGRLLAVLGFDSYYLTAANQGRVKPGWLAYGRRAAMGGPSLLLTSSHNEGPGHLSCAASLAPLARALALRPRAWDSHIRGHAAWFDYGLRLSHAAHATALAPSAVRAALSPPGSPGKPSSGDDGGLVALALALGLWSYGR